MNAVSTSHRGFSLLEMMIALTLATVVTMVVMGVISRMIQRYDELAATYPTHTWKDQLARQLQQEFLHCRSIHVTPQRLVFHGYILTDSATGRTQHGPSIIVYEVVTHNDVSWLIRREFRLGDTAQMDAETSLVARGASRFRLPRPLETDIPPGQLPLVIEGDSAGELMLDIVLVRHGMGR